MINPLLARLSDLFLTDLTAAAGHQMLLIYTSNLAILETYRVCSIIKLERWYKKVFCMAWQGIHSIALEGKTLHPTA